MLYQMEGIRMSGSDEPSFRLPKAILFDLDGTLIDSAPDITCAVNELLDGRGLPPLTLPQVKSMIGNGVEKLVERAFAASDRPLSKAGLEEANREMAPIYRRHITRWTRPMPGAAEALARLHVARIRLGVATNKPQAATREILLHFGMLERLGAIVGGDAVTHKKPAPEALLLALERLETAPQDALMVGDSITDVEAARAAGVPVMLIRGGYSQVPVDELGADLVCGSLLDLPAVLDGLRTAA
jgi:phosphoglycolate phosphatase